MLLRWIVAVILCLQYWRTCEAGSEFLCEGRASGYYADIESGCQVYHMCDGLGRQFSYTCPNTTLFQQRMLICDHWYMVNCSKSELDYSANLLIGQRDKPFVDDSSENPYHRTPRPDLENHPYAPNFRQDYRQGKAQVGTNKNLVGANNDNENTTNVSPYFLPSHWSTQYSEGSTTPLPFKKFSKISDKSSVPAKNTKIITSFKNLDKKDILPLSRITLPPLPPKNTFSTTENVAKFEQKFTRTANAQTSVFPGFSTTTTTTTQVPILRDPAAPPLSKVLLPPRYSPISQNQENLKPEVPRVTQPPSLKPPLSNAELINVLKLSTLDAPRTTTPYPTKITTRAEATPPDYLGPPRGFSLGPSAIATNEVEPPSIFYQPPKLTFSVASESTTMDPVAFYNLIPSKKLEPPIINDRVDHDKTDSDRITTLRSVTKKDTTNTIFSTTENQIDEKKWKELRQMFFIPEYDFPLEVGSGPSYASGISSFNVKQAPLDSETRSTEQPSNVKCDPKCDPAFLVPGTCKPCIMIRR